MAGLKRRRGERGYLLLDALIALSILVAGFGVGFGGLSLAGRMAAGQRDRVTRIIEERNADAMAPATFAQDK